MKIYAKRQAATAEDRERAAKADKRALYIEATSPPDKFGKRTWLTLWWDENRPTDKVAGHEGPGWRGQCFQVPRSFFDQDQRDRPPEKRVSAIIEDAAMIHSLLRVQEDTRLAAKERP